ncbi:related to short-chain alcohol dehydrogenase [Ramularia collo-cygni]|uniref:Related to short-chain alcohol dehydrogenase n=1 Tax=Ramularia collo-cygni TaxID=112498 RepID=A0A2D3UNR5_9PEZI|nr:related to short-chain alcohol dehydrogenase [Ramularia collo-cygni]CZT15198.1 related to short-chain alcohol dehydrogenase [Ramularia collo-cygni]
MSFHFPSVPVDCNVDFDSSALAGKTAVVTGGASGLGLAFVKALVKAGVSVCFGDLNASEGQKLEKELPNTKFVQCDVTKWDDQVRLFAAAAAFSPSKKIHFVVPNAGISTTDDVFSYEAIDAGPSKPDLKAIDVNLVAVMYSAKLAFHYFVKQNGTEAAPTPIDTCLVLIGSVAAFLDVPRCPVYSATKWAQRGIMHALRRTTYHYGSRVNTICPWAIRTNILPKEMFDRVEGLGVALAEADDAGQCLLRILSDRQINGRSLFVSPRKWAPRGYLDLDMEGLPSALTEEIQEEQVKFGPPSLGLFLG